MEYKSLRDFANEKGVTVRSIQRHVKRHENELTDHIKRYGPPRGTYLDTFAQTFISDLLIDGGNLVIPDSSLVDEIDRLRADLEAAHRRIIELQEERNELTQRALVAESSRALADAATNELQAKLETMQAEIRAANDRADTAEEITAKLKSRGLWARITRKHES